MRPSIPYSQAAGTAKRTSCYASPPSRGWLQKFLGLESTGSDRKEPLRMFSFSILPFLVLSSLFSAKVNPVEKRSANSKPALPAYYQSVKELKAYMRLRQMLLPPGDLNASISASPTSINAGSGVTYTINYSTGATASNITGAKISVFLPVPSLNGGRKVVGNNGTATAATSTAVAPAAKAARGLFSTACRLPR